MIVSHMIRPQDSPELGPRWIPALFFLSWSAVSMLSAIELRFVLPILTVLIVYSVWAPVKFSKLRRSSKIITTIGGASLFIIMWYVAFFVRTLQVSGA